MEIGQKIRRDSEGMTATASHGNITEIWEIKSINEEEKYCECYLLRDNQVLGNIGSKYTDKLSFEFINKYKIK